MSAFRFRPSEWLLSKKLPSASMSKDEDILKDAKEAFELVAEREHENRADRSSAFRRTECRARLTRCEVGTAFPRDRVEFRTSCIAPAK